MSGFLTDNYRASKRNKVFETVLLVILTLQMVTMGLTLLPMLDLNLGSDIRAKRITGFLPVWAAGLIPILISRINFPVSEAKRQLILIPLLVIATLLLLGVTVFSWEILKICWQYL